MNLCTLTDHSELFPSSETIAHQSNNKQNAINQNHYPLPGERLIQEKEKIKREQKNGT